MTNSVDLERIYALRFTPDIAFRQEMWQILCAGFFQRYVPVHAIVLEIGAGYCEFINSIHAAKKIAVDLNPDTGRYAASDVRVLCTPSTDLSALEASSVDIAFASNFFEHLSREDILGTMREVRRVLTPQGRFLILQPNYRYCYRKYWMFFDHLTALDHDSLAEALATAGFQTVQMIPRFLPYTTKSRIPRAPSLIKAYLRYPIAWRFLGQQAFAVARIALAEGRP